MISKNFMSGEPTNYEEVCQLLSAWTHFLCFTQRKKRIKSLLQTKLTK